MHLRQRQLQRVSLPAIIMMMAALSAHGGGPRWVQGSGGVFQHPGTPIAWGNGGQISYYTDLGPLSESVSNSAANAMVAAAFAPWNGVVYSAVNLTSSGALNENVSGGNVYIDSSSGTPVVVWPADAQSTYTSKPLAVIYDEDGAIIDLLLGNGASDPLSCNQNGVIEDVDNVSSAGVIEHARLILNGRCTGSSDQLLQMQYQLMRMAGRILGLDWSQANDNVFTEDPAPTLAEDQFWPVMHPIDIYCGPYSYQCMVDPFTLRMDDAAALGRMYPVTTENLAQYPGKQTLATNSFNLTGTVSFPNGQGMNGVNVVVREALPYNNPLVVYPEVKVSSVSGSLYTGDAGNPVTGTSTPEGVPLPEYGSLQSNLEGEYNLAGYQPNFPAYLGWDWSVVSFEPINPLYIGQYSVGPYTLNQVMPAGTLQTVYVPFSFDGGWPQIGDLTVADAPGDASMGAGGNWSQPEVANSTGWWNGRFGAPQQTAWFSLSLQANRIFTVEVTALDENGMVSGEKSMPVIGLWNANDAEGASPEWSTIAFTGASTGATTLTAQTSTAEVMRLALADERGDGRPDYSYRARVLYADNVAPALVSTSGGEVIINGMGFRAGNQIQISGVTASVLSITDSQIVVQAPPLSALSGVNTGTAVDVEVSDAGTGGVTVLSGGLTYVASASSSPDSGAEQIIAISGADQQVSASQTLAPVVLQLLAGNGTVLSGVEIQVSQAMYGWQAVCAGPGRCASPPLLGTANTSLTTNSNGEVTVEVLQQAGTAESTTIVATVGTTAMIQLTVKKNQ